MSDEIADAKSLSSERKGRPHMSLATPQKAVKDGTLTASERAMESCRAAKNLEKAGKYDAAYEALREFWPDRNKEPNLEGPDKSAQAELLLRAGVLSGW